MWGKCKLCENHRMLVKRSHIIPNFMYKSLMDDLNRISFVSLKTNDKGKLLQSGIYESGLLCSLCENLLSKKEDYAKRVLYGGRPVNIQPLDKRDIPGILVSNIDYTPFKLFILSVLWRSHISRHSFFKYVELDKVHQDRIKHLLLTGKAGDECEYRICILGIKTFENDLMRVVCEPTIFELNSGRLAYFFIDGFIYFIALDKELDLEIMSKYSLSEKGHIKIPVLAGEHGRTTLLALKLPEDFVNYFIPQK